MADKDEGLSGVADTRSPRGGEPGCGKTVVPGGDGCE
jgi:hypothetical protein